MIEFHLVLNDYLKLYIILPKSKSIKLGIYIKLFDNSFIKLYLI